MSKQKLQYNIATLSGIDVFVTPWVKDNQLVLMGPEKHRDKPLLISRPIAVLDLDTGQYTGAIGVLEKVGIVRIDASEVSKQRLIKLLEDKNSK